MKMTALLRHVIRGELAVALWASLLVSLFLLYFISGGDVTKGVAILVLPFLALWLVSRVAAEPFYGIVAFLVMRHLVPIGLEGLIRNTTFQQLIYTAVLELTFLALFMHNMKARHLNQAAIPTELPSNYVKVVAFMFSAVLISSLPRIIDYENFFSTRIMTGMEHVNREVYIFFLNGVLLSLLVVVLTDSIDKLRLILWTGVVIGLFIAAEGFLQFFGILVVTTNQEFFYVNELRLTALTGYSPGTTAERMLPPLCFALALVLVERGRRAIFLFFASAILFVAIVLTYTRAVYIAMAVSLAMFFLLSAKSIEIRRIVGKLVAALFVLAVGLMVAVKTLGVVEHFENSGRLGGLTLFGGHSLLVRIMRWVLLKDAIMERPISGYGLGSSKEVLGMYAKGAFSDLYSSVHNFYLSWTVDTGLIGGAALLTLFFFTGKNLLTARKVSAVRADQTVFIFSNVLFASFFGGSMMYIVNSDYAFDIFYFLFFALSHVALRLALGGHKAGSKSTGERCHVR